MCLREVGRKFLQRHKPHAVVLGEPSAMVGIENRVRGVAPAKVSRAGNVETVGNMDGHAVTIGPLAKRSLHCTLLMDVCRPV